MRLYMVDRPGLEPGSLSLRGWTSPSKFAIYLAGVTGFEPVIMISKTIALGQTKLYPNNYKNTKF